MRKILHFIQHWLIPNGSRREKLYRTAYTLFLLGRTHGFRAAIDQAHIYQQDSPALQSIFSRTGLSNIYHMLQSLWLRGTNSVAFLQTTYSYQSWIDKNEPDQKQLAWQRQQESHFAYKPQISFLTPVYNPDADVLRDTLNSVLAQTYSHWEFCLANASSNPEIGQVLDSFAQQDQRIRVIHLADNLGISENTNQALEIAHGDFIALLDHDDLVAPDMLYEVVCVLNEQSDLDVIYFDEDKISADGQTRSSPWFKPSKWSPDLMLSTNYLMHSVIRRELLIKLGKFDTSVDGAQDWDLALRLIEHTRKLKHIPKVFYHWRQVPGSASRDANAKPWAFDAQKRCIQAHIQRQGVEDAQVFFPRLGTVRIIWPAQQAKVSIIIPTKNNLGILQACLSSILEKTTYPDYEVLVVDNQSDDPNVDTYYKEGISDPRIHILHYPYPYNYQAINNWAAQHSKGDVLIFLNNDTEVIEPTWLEELVGWAMRPEIGVVGAKLLRPNGKVQHTGMIIGMMGHASHVFEDCDDHVYTHFGSIDWYRNYMTVTGACLAVRRTVFHELNGLDEAYIVGYGDIDFCLRAVAAGYRVVYSPFAVLLHHEGGTRGLSLPPSDVLRASVKMFTMVQEGDGFFSPNLSYCSRQPVVSATKEEDRGERLVRIMREFGLIGMGMGMSTWKALLLTIPIDLFAMKPHNPVRHQEKFARILIVTHELTRSGAPIVLWMLAQYLKKQGYILQVICPVDGLLRNDYLNDQIAVEVVPRLLEDARVVLPYLNDADIVLCNTILTWRVVYAARAFARPCLWWVHETDFGVELASKHPKIAQAFEAASQVVFPSQATANRYRHFSRYQNYYALLHGFDVDVNTITTEQIIQKQPEELHLLCVATIEKRKGQDILLNAMKALPAEVAAKTHCHLIGRTHIDASFYRKIAWRSFWMRNVHLVGELPNTQVLHYLQQADVFVMASRDEALPVVLIEAMAFSKPIISTNAGGIAEVIHSSKNGYVVDIGDSKAIAEHITRLYYDPTLRNQVGNQAGKDYQTSHTITRFGEQMLQIFEGIYESLAIPK